MATSRHTSMRLTTSRRLRSGRPRLHVVPDPEPLPEPMHPAERRMRDSGGPDDRAVYTCSCGYLFEAPVTASVNCPHCGSGQAW
jgi:rubrerythrin